MGESKFYDGTKLLSLKDINGNTPEIFMCTTNRSGGKTTYFNRLVFNRWIKTGAKFCLIYRFNYELDDVADKFFKDIQGLFFPDYFLTSERRSNGIYHELFVTERNSDEKKSCGYAVTLNSADQIKKLSHFLNDTECMIFDEFQSESDHYCTGEVKKFISLHQSIARGKGKHSRYLPVYMISNPITILNPYYVELDIVSRLTTSTKFLRGNGFVLEQGYVDAAAQAQSESAFNRAFNNNKYVVFSSQMIYLNDNLAFIEKPKGMSRYVCTLKYKDTNFAIREYAEQGILYCDTSPDLTNPNKLSVTTEDHNINYVMLRQNKMFIDSLRFYFDKGCFRFKDLKCKEAIMKALSY